jgi:hypothetical protein
MRSGDHSYKTLFVENVKILTDRAIYSILSLTENGSRTQEHDMAMSFCSDRM